MLLSRMRNLEPLITQRRFRPCLTLLLVAAIIAGTVSCSHRSEDVRVVLITLDTLRWDSFAGTAGKATTMPRLRQWAQRATTFDRFYTSTASTQPSHSSMFTGLHPWQHGVSRNGMRLSETHRTVVEQLRGAGFATSAVVASFPVSRRFGFGQGFGRFHDQFVTGSVSGGEWLDAARRAEAEGGSNETRRGDPFYSLADTVTAQALAEIDAATERRQFFWVHFFDPHAPYGNTTVEPNISPPEVLELAAEGEDPTEALARARRSYDADVSFLDAALARLLERLDEDGSRFETHVVIVSDHGESFGEEGSMAHGRRLIPSQLHVPCVIRSPRLEAGVRHDVASSVDVAATLLSLAGVNAEPAGSSPGRDLTRPARRPRRAVGMRRTYEVPYQDRRLDGSVREIDGYLFFLFNDKGELFRGNRDSLMPPIGSGSDLSQEEGRNLRQLFGEFEHELAGNQADGELDPEVKEKLEALGYVD